MRLVRVLPWPLLLVLVAQAAGSLSLIRSNTAFQDEALYLWAGHLQIAAWLHGTPIPAFPTYFSGAPVLYPPLAAVADTLGGLAGARALSLVLLLGATCFLWATARDLAGRRVAFFACALFALAGPSLRLGAFATYDGMSLCLMAAAAWFAVRAGRGSSASGWLVAAALALALANATKYASALFDPVVLGLVAVTAARAVPWREALGRAATLGAYTAGMVGVLLVLGGGEYFTGIAQTTLARAVGHTRSEAIAALAWRLTGLVVVLGAIGALLAWVRRRSGPERALILLLSVAALLVPLAYLRLGSMTSLSKHLDFGIWFAAIAAGWAISQAVQLIRWRRPRVLVTALLVAAMFLPAWVGLGQAQALFHTWPNSSALITTVSRVLPHTRGPILAEDPSLFEYYLPQGRQWIRWSSGCSIRLPNGRSISQPVGRCYRTREYVKFLRRGYFSAVILLFGPSGRFDGPVRHAISASQRYRRAATVAYGYETAYVFVRDTQPVRAESPTAARQSTPLQALLIPTARANAVLGSVAAPLAVAGLVTLGFTLLVRLLWRRRKAVMEL